MSYVGYCCCGGTIVETSMGYTCDECGSNYQWRDGKPPDGVKEAGSVPARVNFSPSRRIETFASKPSPISMVPEAPGPQSSNSRGQGNAFAKIGIIALLIAIISFLLALFAHQDSKRNQSS